MRPIEVVARDLTKAYGPVHAVADVSFTAPAGQVTAILGGNGAGKSTTLRLMLGLARGGGHATFGGRRLSDWPEPHQIAGVFLGTPAFHPRRTVRAHLRTLLVGTGVRKGRVDEVLEIVGLAEWASARPRGFSTGMKQRLGIAAALLCDPSVLVLDEPTNGLDPLGVIAMREVVTGHARRGGTVILASHLLAEVTRVADRAVLITGGTVVADDTIAGLLSQQSHVVARCDEPLRLRIALQRRGAVACSDGPTPDSVTISGLGTRAVAAVAREQDILLWELRSCDRSLEDVYLERIGQAASPTEDTIPTPLTMRKVPTRVSS